MTLLTSTPFRPQQSANGVWSVPGFGPIQTIVEDTETGRDWLSELGLPADYDILNVLAQAQAFSTKWLRFVIADESKTRFTGQYRLQPRRIAHTVDGIHFTFGHLGLIIGECRNVHLARPGEIPDTEGHALIGEAQLYQSLLAQKAWNGLTHKILTGVCGVLLAPPGTPQGQGGILEVALTDYPGCPGARVLRFWEE